MIDTDKYEGHTAAPWTIDIHKVGEDTSAIVIESNMTTHSNCVLAEVEVENKYAEADAQLIADAPLLLQEVKRFRKMCLDEMVCYDCLSDLYKAGLSDENPVDAYWCGMCSEPMKGLVE